MPPTEPESDAADDLPEVRPRRLRIGVGAAVVLVLLALAIAVLVGALAPVGATSVIAPSAAGTTSAVGRGAVASSDSTAVADQPDGAALLVHVLGAVAHPGLYRLDPGARVVDAVTAAGGFSAEADRASVNLARSVADGEQLRVLAQGESPPAAAGAEGGVQGAATGPLDLNHATLAQLDELPRVGPATAQRIVAYRDENGPFTSVDDLLEVPGIGAKTLDGLRDLVRV
jgi:competence protein ComEA